jgi:hypothetical protein
VKFGRKPRLLPDRVSEIQNLRAEGATVPDIIKRTGFSKASIYRALGRWGLVNGIQFNGHHAPEVETLDRGV